MANSQHLKILQENVNDWNRWRKYSYIEPELSNADLSYGDLRDANLSLNAVATGKRFYQPNS
ncbi:MAG: hypothetical protein QNJ54_31745 [Prochloraceae cyanobacterium]|nr:hypothetical protein [Prochloraceae cyanobacterium]